MLSSLDGVPSESTTATAISTDGSGRPTSTPAPGGSASTSRAVTSVAGRTSVMPYGVRTSHSGHRSMTSRSNERAIGAPASSSSRRDDPARASRVRAREPGRAPESTELSAAGDIHITVPPACAIAADNDSAVSEPGREASIAGMTEEMPNRGPSTAHGAKAATRTSSSVNS